MNANSPVFAAHVVAQAVSAQPNHLLRKSSWLRTLSMVLTVPGAWIGLASGSND